MFSFKRVKTYGQNYDVNVYEDVKNRKGKDERQEEAISIIENGFDGVKGENLLPVLKWLDTK